MAYGTAPDAFDEYLKMSERTIRRYLRRPTPSDIQALYAAHEARHGFRGMLGSIDCTHWEWQNCPNAWRGQYMRGDHQHPTIMLEAVASADLWIWHAFFGIAGSSNDINVLDLSPIFDDIVNGTTPDSSFHLRGTTYKLGDYLADGIYPEYATMVKAYNTPVGEKHVIYTSAQMSARKDVERAFDILKQRWHIIKYPARAWSPAKIRRVMYACIILHNMILEDEEQIICQYNEHEMDVPIEEVNEVQQRANRRDIRNREVHHQLKSDLVDNIFERSQE
ncbi:uncharacterized protein LOC110876522 [Helianthus annuus]|uniref:uncharacterized protein LOC110876522 n=1 Tax=Helianthus annuus TaxID=4232 RepID=UPI000B8F6FBB|nr:uncharacterized protein LOC110876522 [Helianthus annuus]